MKKPIVEWRAPEYRHQKKSADWLLSVGIVGVALAAVAVILGNALFGVFLLIATGALLVQSVRAPRVVRFALSERGVSVGETLYPYSSLDAFWVADENETDPRLLVKSKKVFAPLLSIPVGTEDIDDLRDTLAEFLPEEELHEPVVHALLEWAGF